MKKGVLIALFALAWGGFLTGQTVKIGDILCTDGTTVSPAEFAASGRTADGIVFFIDDPEGRAWATSLECQSVNTHWVTQAHYSDAYDIPDLPNCELSREALFDLDGYNNTFIIRNAHGNDWYPAAWCVDYEQGWHLPSGGQLRWMMAYINEINASLQLVGGTPFIFDQPRWYWTSTERTGAHAVVVSQTGSVGNYPKYNYIGEYEIGVRAVKEFDITPQPVQIGEVADAPDGQRGVVFYVSPDDGSYWLVALNDLPNRYEWGLLNDIAALENYNSDNQYVTLHGVHCGYDATMAMRQAQQSNPQYAASHVDLENGWHIPSIGQLSKLYAALPFVEQSLTANGGATLSGDYYWSSTECSSQQAWAINFGDNLYTEGIMAVKDKSTSFSVRPILSISCEAPLPPEPELPDNILDSDCNDNMPIPFEGGHLLHQTTSNINVYASPLCGDIDADGVVDIVIPHFTATDDDYRIWSNQIDIYSGNDLSLQNTISIPQEVYCTYLPIGIVRYPLENGQLQGAIVVLCNDGILRSYSKNGQLLNTADTAPPCDGVVAFADFNYDGHPEVYIGNAIYDAATLRLLCKGPANGNKGLSYRGSPSSPFPHHSNYAIPYAYNVLGDEKLELVCGNTIYDVNIVSRTNPSLNSCTVNKTITPPTGYPQDGNVALADLDLDGEIDVVVTKDLTDDCVVDYTYFYAYKPSTEAILFEYKIMCRSAGYPAICNIDADPHPEILFTDYLYDVPEEKMRCMRYTTTTGLNEVWSIHHNDPSGMTSMTFFDFNRDEIPEIVYRDAYNLNIMDGTTGTTLYSTPMRSGTSGEHPTIADVNNDGHAEILAVGLLGSYNGNNGHGNLVVVGNDAWPAARKVWNQYAYNITNVNNDLTIPKLCFDNATVFTTDDGTIRRPYNNIQMQAGYITPEGEPYNPGGIVEVDIDGTGCNSFTFNDSTYFESGQYDQLVEANDGCDTLYHINVNLGQTVTHDIWRVHCYSYVWNGTEYTESGLYEQTFIAPCGCDSIVTLHLQIADTITHEWSAQACQSFTWNGTTYTQSGDHVQAFLTTHDCDSIVTLHLTIGETLEYEADSTVCGSLVWNGQEYTQNGTYSQQFIDTNGCDSIMHLNLTVMPYPAAIPEIEGLDHVYVATDIVLGQYFYSIDSVPFATHYEWILEGADWPMDTTGTECGQWITSAGTATLTVRAWNDCGFSEQSIIIHAGFYDVDDIQGIPVNIYPNPAKEKVIIEADGIRKIRLIDMQGQVVKDLATQGSNHVEIIVEDCASAIYLLEIVTERGTARQKIDVRR